MCFWCNKRFQQLILLLVANYVALNQNGLGALGSEVRSGLLFWVRQMRFITISVGEKKVRVKSTEKRNGGLFGDVWNKLKVNDYSEVKQLGMSVYQCLCLCSVSVQVYLGQLYIGLGLITAYSGILVQSSCVRIFVGWGLSFSIIHSVKLSSSWFSPVCIWKYRILYCI